MIETGDIILIAYSVVNSVCIAYDKYLVCSQGRHKNCVLFHDLVHIPSFDKSLFNHFEGCKNGVRCSCVFRATENHKATKIIKQKCP